MTKKDASKIADAGSWRDFYRAAIFEPDPNKLPERIFGAQFALAAHAKGLCYATGEDAQERETVHNAIRILQVLQGSLKQRPAVIQQAGECNRRRTA